MDKNNSGNLPYRTKSCEKSIPGVKWHHWNKIQPDVLRPREPPPGKKKLLRVRSFWMMERSQIFLITTKDALYDGGMS